MAGLPPDIDELDGEGLKSLLLQVLEENAVLRRENVALREEIARLKGQPPQPKLKPSGMDKATGPWAQGRRQSASGAQEHTTGHR